MKTTKAQFNRFKKEFKKWIDRLGLQGYSFYYEHKDIGDNYADISVNELTKIAIVRMTDGVEYKEGFNPERSAKHEAIHLLLSPLSVRASWRFVDEDELEMAEETVCRILEDIL